MPSGATAPSAPAFDISPIVKVVDSFAPVGWQSEPSTLSSPGHPGTDGAIDQHTAATLNEFRCTDVIARIFRRGQRFVFLRVYRFDTPAGAYGAYTTMREGAGTVVQRGDGSSENDQSISFWQGHYFVKLYTTSEDDDEAKGMLSTLADKLAVDVGQHADMPRIMSRLPQLDRISGSERLIMGPITARQFFPAPYMGMLALDRARVAAVADYHFREPYPERLKLLVVDYGGNAQLASTAYRDYTSSLQESHKTESSASYSLFKMTDGYLMCQLRGDQLAIITGARKKYSPTILARHLSF